MERGEVELDGVRFAWIERGEGPLAIFLHGFPDVPATWMPVMERLRGLRCVAPYLRGYAPSTTRGPFDLDRLGRDVVALADALAPCGPVFLRGHDWGARAAWAALAAAPDRFRPAVIASVPHPSTLPLAYLRNPSQLVRSAYVGFFQLPVLPERALARGLARRLWRAWSPGFEPPAAHLDEVARTLEASGGAPLELYRALPRSILVQVPRWPRVRTPTLYLHGLDDRCIAPELARDHARVFASPHRTELVPAGHFVPLEAPERVAELAQRWLDR